MQQQLLKEKRSDIFKVDPRIVIADESFNIRVDYGNIEELMQSILENGIEKPLKGYRETSGGEIYVTDGFRRFRAVQNLLANGSIDIERDQFRIPFTLEPKGTRKEDRYFSMFITQDQKPLEPIEICNLFYKLKHQFNFSVEEIAKKIGKSKVYVYDMLKLAEAPKEIRDAVANKEVKHTAAIEVIKNEEDADVISSVLNDAKVKSGGKPVSVKDVKARKQKETNVPLGNLGLMREMLKHVDNYDTKHPGEIDPCKRFGLSFMITFLDKRDIPFAEAVECFKKDAMPNS